MSQAKTFSAKSFLIGATTGVAIISLTLILLFLPSQDRDGDGELSQDREFHSLDSSIQAKFSENSEFAGSRDRDSRVEKNSNESLSSLVADDVADVGQLVELLRATEELWSHRGMSALQLIFDSVDDSAVRESLIGSILHEAMESGHKNVFSEALILKGEARRWVLHEIVTDWARKDPQSTVAAVWALAPTDPSIRMLQRRTVWEWAEIEPRKMLANMDVVPDNIRDFAQEKALLALTQIDPEAVVRYLKKFSGSSREATLAHAIAERWIEFNPSATLAWVGSHEFLTPGLRSKVFETAFRTYARVDPQCAFQTALKQRRPMGTGAIESIVIAEIAKSDTAHAASLLSQVRNEPHTVFNSYRATAQAMVQFHQEFDQALELGKQIPHWRETFYRDLSIHWAAHQPVELLDRLELVPVEYRSFAAYAIIVNNSVSLVLGSQQIQQARTYLNDDHLAQVSNLPKHYVSTVQFPTHGKVVYSPAELASIAAKSNAAQREVKLRRQGFLEDKNSTND